MPIVGGGLAARRIIGLNKHNRRLRPPININFFTLANAALGIKSSYHAL
jgi:hypothetical protein